MDRALDRIGSTADGSSSEKSPCPAGIIAMARRGKVRGCAAGIRGRFPATGDIFVFARWPRQVIVWNLLHVVSAVVGNSDNNRKLIF